MNKLRSVNTFFWSDCYVETLTPVEKLLFLYLLTNSNTNIIGIYELTIKKISYDTGIDKDKTEQSFKKFQEDKKVYYIDNFIILRNFTKNQSYNPKMIIGAFDVFSKLPDSLLKYIIPYHSLCIAYFNLFKHNSQIISKFNSLCIAYDSLYIPYDNIIKDEYNKKGIKDEFEIFRKQYPGSKNGLDFHYKKLEKKYLKELYNIIPKLLPALEKEIDNKNNLKQNNLFCPEWKHLQTWLNECCWEQEFAQIQESIKIPIKVVHKFDKPAYQILYDGWLKNQIMFGGEPPEKQKKDKLAECKLETGGK